MRYAQTVRFNLSHDRRKTNTNDVYSAEDAVINFGDNQTLLWSEIKDTVDFTKLIVDSSGSFPNLTTAQKTTAQTLQDVIDIKNSTTSSFITNRHPGDFLLESDSENTTQSIINGGKFNLSGPDTEITLNGAKGGGSTKTTTITEEQVQIADTADFTLLTFTSDSIQIQTEDGSGTITETTTIKPNSIQFEPVLQTVDSGTFTDDASITSSTCKVGYIDLGTSPTSHESGPEYKLTVRVNKQSSLSPVTPSDYRSFTIQINVGSWLNNINTTNNTFTSFTSLDNALFDGGSDRLLYSDNISGQTLFYKRVARIIWIAWIPDSTTNILTTALQYKLTQIA